MLLRFLLTLMFVGIMIKAQKNVLLGLEMTAKNARNIPFALGGLVLGHIQGTGIRMITAMKLFVVVDQV